MKSLILFLSVSSLFALGPCPMPETEVCFRGANPADSCKGMSCAPCWIDQGGFWGCYDKTLAANGKLECPNWNNIVDITSMPTSCKKSEVPGNPANPPQIPENPTNPPPQISEKPTSPPTQAPETVCPDPEDECYRGAEAGNMCIGKDCPRCWMWDNKQWNCFDMVNNACPWSGMIDIMNRPKNCVLPYCS